MIENKNVITGLYNAYKERNPELMASFYTEDASFKDEIFGEVTGQEIPKVWEVVHSTTSNFYLYFHIVNVNKNLATVNSQLSYTFKHTGRKIDISITSIFRFENGKIRHQVDEYSLWKWASQAFGVSGFLLGWNPKFKNKIRQSAQNTIASM